MATEETEKKETAKKEKKESGNTKLKEAQKQIQDLTESLSTEKDKYLRLYAEFDTYRRRSAEERLNLVASAATDTIKGLLPVLDDCESALKLLAASGDEKAVEGPTLIYNKLMTYLKGRGLAVIEAKGAKFDTDFHEAVTQFPVEDEAQKGTVIDVIQTGYTLNGKVIRYAKVVVGA